MYLSVEKMNLFIHLLMSLSKLPPDSYYHTHREKDITHFPQAAFFLKILILFSRQKRQGEKFMSWKIIKINLCWYWSQVLINPTFFVFVLLCHNLDSGMLKCKDFNATEKNPLKKCTGITVWKMKCCPTRFFNRFTHRIKLNSLSLHFLSILKSFIPLPY